GSTGWVASILVNIMQVAEDDFDGTSEVTTVEIIEVGTILGNARVNVRSGAGSEFETVAGLEPGSEVRIIGTNSAGDWYNIVLPNGGEGWIASFLVSVEEMPA